jgi:EmrB/QacA subfamily drug resistance transporter
VTTATVIATRRGALILLLLCAVQFLDIVDSSIMNVALPSIRRDLGFTPQGLTWVLSGYLVSYGGFLLLGGRLADLLGRRRMLVGGTALFAVCSFAGGLAQTGGELVAARVAQGVGAALMAPAGLSILTTTFSEGRERQRALGFWGAVSGVAGASGVFFGGVLSEGPGWRWVLFVNIPVCLAVIASAYRLLGDDARRTVRGGFDLAGAVLITAGMLMLIFAVVRAPESGWGSARTLGELATAGLLLAAFVVNERRQRHPLFPFAILRVKGLAAADATQLLAFAGFVSMFFFLTLLMQNVLGFSPIQSGAAYLPVTAGIVVAAGLSTVLTPRIGSRLILVAGCILAAAGMFQLARAGIDASYRTDLLPGLVVLSLGLGAVFVTATAAANAGVRPDQAGLAAGLLNSSLQLGSALGLATLSAVATARTGDLLGAGQPPVEALAGGFQRALLVAGFLVLAAALIATRTANTRHTEGAA